MNDADAAVDLFVAGCACSQAILGTYGPRHGIDEGVAMRVAAGFAGGMRIAETCGAVTGAFMVFGLARCTESCRTMDGRKAAYAAITSFARAFRQRHGSLACRELLGCDISTPEGAKLAEERRLFRTKCPQLVRDAAELLEATLAGA